MRSLVLGGAGFLGSYVVDELVAAGHVVTSLDRYQERFRNPNKNIEFCKADFDNRSELEEALKRGVDAVVHLVSSVIPQTSNDDPVFDAQSNLLGSIALFEMCVKHGVRKVVFISSGGTVYGIAKTDVIKEDHTLLPLCSYGITKLAIEHYLQLFHSLHGLKFYILRLSNSYGARQDPYGKQGAPSVFMHKMLTGQKINVWGDGSAVRDFIYASDCAKACLAAIRSESVGVLNIGSGIPLSIKQLISAIEKVTGVSARINWLPARWFDVPRSVLDCARAKEQLGWQPIIPLDDGLSQMRDWMKGLIQSGQL